MAEDENTQSSSIHTLRVDVDIDVASPDVRTLMEKASAAASPDEALKWSQAALNIANAQCNFMETFAKNGDTDEDTE